MIKNTPRSRRAFISYVLSWLVINSWVIHHIIKSWEYALYIGGYFQFVIVIAMLLVYNIKFTLVLTNTD